MRQFGTLSEATHILVSSVNMDGVALLKTDGRSLIYIRNNSGPRQDPCGIPHLTILNEEFSSLRVQLCLRSVKYDMYHSNSIPTTPCELAEENVMIHCIESFLDIKKYHPVIKPFIHIK